MQSINVRSVAALLLMTAAGITFADETQTADSGTSHTHCIYHAKHEQSGEKPDFLADFALTDAQKQDIGALVQLYQPRLSEIRKRGEARRRELIATAPDDPSYTVLSDDVAAEAASSAREVVILLTELQTNVYNLLSIDQQAKYNDMRDSMLARLEAYAQQQEAARQSDEYDGPFGFGGSNSGDSDRGEPHVCIEHTHSESATTEATQ